MPRLRIVVRRGGASLCAEELRSLADVEEFGASLRLEIDELLSQARWRFADFEARRWVSRAGGPGRVRLIQG